MPRVIVVARGAQQLALPGGERGQRRQRRTRGRRHRGRREEPWRAAGVQRQQIVAELVQRIDHARHRPRAERAAVATAHGIGHLRPVGRADALAVQRQRRLHLPAGRGQQHLGIGHALPCEPRAACGDGWRGDRQTLAAAAHRGQQGLRVVGREQQAQTARRFFERLQQRVRGHGVHRRRGMDDEHLGAAARAGALAPVDRLAQRVYSDLAARLGLALAFAVIGGLGVAAAPAERHAQGIGQQQMEVRMRVRVHQAAGRAVAAGAAVGWRLAQPGA